MDVVPAALAAGVRVGWLLVHPPSASAPAAAMRKSRRRMVRMAHRMSSLRPWPGHGGHGDLCSAQRSRICRVARMPPSSGTWSAVRNPHRPLGQPVLSWPHSARHRCTPRGHRVDTGPGAFGRTSQRLPLESRPMCGAGITVAGNGRSGPSSSASSWLCARRHALAHPAWADAHLQGRPPRSGRQARVTDALAGQPQPRDPASAGRPVPGPGGAPGALLHADQRAEPRGSACPPRRGSPRGP